MLKKSKYFLFILIFVLSSSIRADLVFDGIPTPLGNEVGDATAEMMVSVAYFYDSLGQWERATSDNSVIDENTRLERSKKSFETAVEFMEIAVNKFKSILNSTDENLIQTLKQPIPSPEKRFLEGKDIDEILIEHNHKKPSIYSDVVLIASKEAEKLLNLFKETQFSQDVEEYRSIVYKIHEALNQTILVGLATGVYTVHQQ